MIIEFVRTADLGEVIAQLIAQGLKFRVWSVDGHWSIEINPTY